MGRSQLEEEARFAEVRPRQSWQQSRDAALRSCYEARRFCGCLGDRRDAELQRARHVAAFLAQQYSTIKKNGLEAFLSKSMSRAIIDALD